MVQAFPCAQIPVAYFVTDHGYGHATRAAAVMSAMEREIAGVRFEVFTTAPRWLFQSQPPLHCRIHPETTDVGLVQSTPFEADLTATTAALARFLPFDGGQVARIGSYLRKIGCRMVICDIAPIGIEVGRQAGIPTVLVENFTWDWIYEPYHFRHSRLEGFSQYLKAVCDSAEIRIQAAPCCQEHPGALRTAPVCRPPTSQRSRVRASLGVTASETLVLVSMGGLGRPSHFQHALPGDQNVIFAIPGTVQKVLRSGNTVLLPSHRAPPHQDLVNAADAVVGKVGYSTLAEVYQAGVPFGFMARADFRESAVLVDFIKRRVPSVAIDPEKFKVGNWGKDLEALLSQPRLKRATVNGARQVARHLKNCL